MSNGFASRKLYDQKAECCKRFDPFHLIVVLCDLFLLHVKNITNYILIDI